MEAVADDGAEHRVVERGFVHIKACVEGLLSNGALDHDVPRCVMRGACRVISVPTHTYKNAERLSGNAIRRLARNADRSLAAAFGWRADTKGLFFAATEQLRLGG